jgi:SAM-dependent methyltransferase
VKSVAAVATTLCRLLGVDRPVMARAPALGEVVDAAPSRVERMLFYAPDAVGASILDAHHLFAGRLAAVAPLRVELEAVRPAKTPVCFASMFTGAPPELHGIRKYEKPVLRVDTAFDALSRANRKVAIVAVTGSSMDLIFRNRPLGYYSEDNDAGVNRRALELIAADSVDLIVAYHQEYDDLLHKERPDSPAALEALERHVAAFETFCAAADRHWAARVRCCWFGPDHGAHANPETGLGEHGDAPEDGPVWHYVRFAAVGPAAPAESKVQGLESSAPAAGAAPACFPSDATAPALIDAMGDFVGMRVLEIGCGDGYFSRQLAMRGAWVTAIDASEKLVAGALRTETEKPIGIEYHTLDPQAVAGNWGADSFDLVVSCNSLASLPRPDAALRAAARTLARDGRLIVTVPLPPAVRYTAEQWVSLIESSGFGVRRITERWTGDVPGPDAPPSRPADYLVIEATPMPAPRRG